jgi:hypothetical protein
MRILSMAAKYDLNILFLVSNMTWHILIISVMIVLGAQGAINETERIQFATLASRKGLWSIFWQPYI